MKQRTFKLSHSLLGTLALLALESLLFYLHIPANAGELAILAASVIGAIVTIYVATEAIEEVQGSRRLFAMLSVVISQFVVFFGFQYWFLILVQPGSFPTLTSEPVHLLLNSVMVFVFNPIDLPATVVGRALVLINSVGSIGLVLFVLQNISQFRRKSLDAHE